MLYFAYGANMSVPHMVSLCPGARLMGTGKAEGWEFYVMSNGFASIRLEFGKSVYGVVWTISEADMNELDWFEDTAQGLYRKENVDITLSNGTASPCLTYIGNDSVEGVPLTGYVENIIRDSHIHGLPSAYIADLERWLP